MKVAVTLFVLGMTWLVMLILIGAAIYCGVIGSKEVAGGCASGAFIWGWLVVLPITVDAMDSAEKSP